MALSENQLLAFINETVNKWALEEYQANGPEVAFEDRHAENMEGVIEALSLSYLKPWNVEEREHYQMNRDASIEEYDDNLEVF